MSSIYIYIYVIEDSRYKFTAAEKKEFTLTSDIFNLLTLRFDTR